jgi:putative AbiEii toxin of type IV toxin-antitoxin system/uncharacterized protein DUF3696
MLDSARRQSTKTETKISLQDFRCFHKVPEIPLRPINILVGENSTGKSSFLAAVRFLLALTQRTTKASFNKDPFFLGSYEQIAHYRGGRYGRAKTFSFSMTGALDKEFVLRRVRVFMRDQQNIPAELPDDFKIKFTFHNNRSQPAIYKVDFEAGPFSFSFSVETSKTSPRAKVSLRGPNVNAQYPPSGLISTDRPVFDDPLSNELSDLDFVLQDARYSLSKGRSSKLIRDELHIISNLYRSALRVLPREVYASAPVRSRPERTYNPGESSPSPSGEHIPFVLAQIKAFDRSLWIDVARTLGRFGKSSGLFDAINIKQLSKTEGGPFQLIVDLNGSKSNIIDVGYGVSQVLPIVTDVVRAREPTCFLFQQPEVHLHPKAQAELATFLAQMVGSRRHTLFLETHSDYLIDRIRMEARDGRHISPEDVSILFFERAGKDVDVYTITVDKQGNVRGAPKGYRAFFIEEEFRSLGG